MGRLPEPSSTFLVGTLARSGMAIDTAYNYLR